MKQIIYISGILVLLAFIMAGCEEDSPLEGEQYIKQVYIVGSDETTDLGMSTVEIPYSESDEQETYISIATGGSLNIDKDITVSIVEAGDDVIDDYNFKYLEDDDIQYQLLNNSYYSIPDYEVEIKAGEVYGQMPIYIDNSTLNCDSLYALTFQISAVSDPDYISIRETDTVLIQTYKFVNDYSGTYQEEGYYYTWDALGDYEDSTSVSATREFTAVNYNTVRLYHLATTESFDNVEDAGVTFTVESDNSLAVATWKNLDVVDGGGTYNASSKTFKVWYNYQVEDVVYQFSGNYVGEDED